MRSPRSRLGAAVTAGMAMSAVGLLSLTGGTVAQPQLSDSLSVKAEVGVEGVPYGIARGVSYGLTFEKRNTAGGGTRSVTTSVDSRTGPAHTLTAYPANGTRTDSVELRDTAGVRACASSNVGGNTTRCPGTTGPAALVSASSGNEISTEKYKVEFKNHHMPDYQIIQIHDVYTRVECRADGTVSAARPKGAWRFGGTGTWAGRKWDWSETPRDLVGPNTFDRYRLWTGNWGAGWNTTMTLEVQTISQTFSNPPRALSALVFQVSSADDSAQNRMSNMAVVSKSECAVSPDGSVNLDPNTTFGPTAPDTRDLEVPGWTNKWDYLLVDEGSVGTGPFNYVSQPGSRNADRTTAEGIELVESGELEVIDPLTGRPAGADEEPGTTESSPTSPSTPTRAASPSPSATSTTAATAPTTTAATTTTSAGPDPSGTTTAATSPSYSTADGQAYSRAGGTSLTAAQRALVEEAIAAADSADNGELADGATYAVTTNQLDGTTLIVTTADGGTLRIVWEK